MKQARWIWTIAIALVVGLVGPAAAESPLGQSVQDFEGKPVDAARLGRRVTALVVTTPKDADVASEVGQELVFQFGSNKNFAFISVTDLKAVPAADRAKVSQIIQQRVELADQQIQARFKQAGRPYTPGLTSYVPDYGGKLVTALLQASPQPEFALFDKDPARLSRFEREKFERDQIRLRNRVHIFLLDSAGEVSAHYLDKATTPVAVTRLSALLAQARAAK
ncbi:MAG: hypothetical protein H7Y22_16380 [Gemmatimonadaceae bacterium]|nr:hypothetical protein [Gloeobacterales cyanobacterium ES-bin-141]